MIEWTIKYKEKTNSIFEVKMSVNKGDDNQNQSTPAAQAEGFSERQNSSVSVKGLPRENS